MPAFRISIPLSTSAVELPESVPDVMVAVEVVVVVTTEPPVVEDDCRRSLCVHREEVPSTCNANHSQLNGLIGSPRSGVRRNAVDEGLMDLEDLAENRINKFRVFNWRCWF